MAGDTVGVTRRPASFGTLEGTRHTVDWARAHSRAHGTCACAHLGNIIWPPRMMPYSSCEGSRLHVRPRQWRHEPADPIEDPLRATSRAHPTHGDGDAHDLDGVFLCVPSGVARGVGLRAPQCEAG